MECFSLAIHTHVNNAQSVTPSVARAASAGFVPKGDLIWYQAGTRLRPYGYPRAFVPNIAHQHIVVLRKPPAVARRACRCHPMPLASSTSRLTK